MHLQSTLLTAIASQIRVPRRRLERKVFVLFYFSFFKVWDACSCPTDFFHEVIELPQIVTGVKVVVLDPSERRAALCVVRTM
jgi:hypothetical protein